MISFVEPEILSRKYYFREKLCPEHLCWCIERGFNTFCKPIAYENYYQQYLYMIYRLKLGLRKGFTLPMNKMCVLCYNL